MIVPLLIQRAFQSERIVATKTPRGYALVVNYFGIRLVISEMTEAEFAELTKPRLVPVS